MKSWPNLYGIKLSNSEIKCLIGAIQKLLRHDSEKMVGEIEAAILRDVHAKLHQVEVEKK